MAKGLCFLCGPPYERGHRCANKGNQLFLVEILDEEDKAQEVGGIEEEVEFEDKEVGPQISINAICGNSGFQTIRVNR